MGSHRSRQPWRAAALDAAHDAVLAACLAAADDVCREGREQLDLQWEQLKRQREEDEAFTRACKARSDDRWAQIAALRAECESMARAETRRKLYEDAERVWGPDWQSR